MNFKLIIILFALFSLIIHQETVAQTSNISLAKKANKLYSNGYYDIALKLYIGLLGTEVNEIELHRKISSCYYRLKDIPNAAYWQEKVISNDKNKEEDLLIYANILKINENYSLANNYYDQFESFGHDISAYKEQLAISKKIRKKKKNASINKLDFKKSTNQVSSFLHPDGFYYISDKNNFASNFLGDDDLDIYLAKLNSDNEMYDFEKLKGKINSSANETSISFQSPKNAFITREIGNSKDLFNKVTKSAEPISHKFEIVNYKLKNSKWVEQILPAFNKFNASSAYPAFDKHGRILVFSSNRFGGYGGYDLYFCYYNANRGWSEPKNLGSEINTSFDEVYPFLDNNNNLFFSSDGHISIGFLDVYFSKRDGNSWAKPENLGVPINSEFDDYGIVINNNNKSGYLTSDRNQGNNNIYSFELKNKVPFEKQKFTSYTSQSIRLDKSFDRIIYQNNDEFSMEQDEPASYTIVVKDKNQKKEYGEKDNMIKDQQEVNNSNYENNATNIETELSTTKDNIESGLEEPIITKAEPVIKEEKVPEKSIKKEEKPNNAENNITELNYDAALSDKYVLFFAKVNSPTILQFILSDLGVVKSDELKDGRSYNYIGYYDTQKNYELALENIIKRGFTSKIIPVKVKDLEQTVTTAFDNDEEKYNPNKNDDLKTSNKEVDISNKHYRIELPPSQNPEVYFTVFKDIGKILSSISPNKTDVYYIGVFKSESNAKEKLNEMLERGLSSGKVIPFINEERQVKWDESQSKEFTLFNDSEKVDSRIKTDENGDYIIVFAETDNPDVYDMVLKDLADVKQEKRKDGSDYRYIGKFSSKNYADQIIVKLKDRGIESIELVNITKQEIPFVQIISEEEAEVINLDEIPSDADLAKEFVGSDLKTTWLIRLIDIQNPALYELIFKPYGKIVQRTENDNTIYYLGEYFSEEDAKQVEKNIKLLGLQTPTKVEKF